MSRSIRVQIGDTIPVIDGTTAIITGQTPEGEVLALFADTNEEGILTGCRLDDYVEKSYQARCGCDWGGNQN